MKINGDVQQTYQQRFIYVEHTVKWTTYQLTLHGMVKILTSMNLENLYVIYNPSHHLLKNYTTEHKKDNSWVKKNRDTMKWWDPHKKYSNNVNLKYLMTKTITLAKVGHQALNI